MLCRRCRRRTAAHRGSALESSFGSSAGAARVAGAARMADAARTPVSQGQPLPAPGAEAAYPG
eukprot:1342098-Pyramimonas_sp.AAC.1